MADITKLIERLRAGITRDAHEKCMKAWDTARSMIADGHRGSLPRDMIESIMLNKDEDLSEAIAALERLSTTPEVTIDDAMVERASIAYWEHGEENERCWLDAKHYGVADNVRVGMRAALAAALNTTNKE